METENLTPELQQELDGLLAEYKAAVEAWVATIREEEKCATPDHSMKEWNIWDDADVREEEARGKAKDARKAYTDALREKLFNSNFSS
jgi:hypothetical protein